MDSASTVTVDDRYSLQVEECGPRFRNGPVAKQWWLIRDGVPVAFMATLTFTDGRQGGCDFQLCDIEVREEYRRQGLTRILVGAIEQAEGLPLWTSGSFTPLGAEALGWLRVKPWETAGVKVDDMHFVDDWDTQRPRFPL